MHLGPNCPPLTKTQDRRDFYFQDTSADYLVHTVLPQIQIIPHMLPDFSSDFVFLRLGQFVWKCTWTKKVAMSAYHGVICCAEKRCSSRNSFFNGRGSSSRGTRLRWSSTKFFVPFLSLISKSNSCSNRIRRINLGLASFFFSRYSNVAWSKNTIIFVRNK